jgi:hypothetical protein
MGGKMSFAILVRVAKLVALFGFFMPWALISCSGQPIVELSGFDVAIGNITAANPMTGQEQSQNIGLNFFVLIAMAATLGGLLGSFAGEGKAQLRAPLIGALVAIVAAFAGMMWLKDMPKREARNARTDTFQGQMNAASASALRIQERGGYWFTLAALGGTAALAAFGQSDSAPSLGGLTGALGRRPEDDDDLTYWDHIDKNDAIALRAYLSRFPQGRFAELARMKLAQLSPQADSAPASPASLPPENSAPPQYEASPEAPAASSYEERPAPSAYSPPPQSYTYDDEPAAPASPRIPPAVIIVTALLAAGVAFAALVPQVRDGISSLFAGKADDAAFLQAAGFNDPIQAQVNLNYFETPDGQLARGDNPALLALLADGAFLTVQPAPEAAPYWRFAPAGGALDGQRLSVTIGQREVTSRKDTRRWSANGASYMAETIVYTIKLDDKLRTVDQRSLGPFELRLVAVEDPRVGEWQLQSADYAPARNEEAGQVLAAVRPAGEAGIERLREQVRLARTAAYDTIAQQLAANQLLDVDPQNANVLRAGASRLAYLRTLNPLQRVSIEEIISRCASARENGYGTWRVPTIAEMAPIVRQHTPGFGVHEGVVYYGNLLDVPDGRLWGQMAAPGSENAVLITADTFDQMTIYNVPPNGARVPTVRGYKINADGTLDLNNGSSRSIQQAGLYNPLRGPPRVANLRTTELQFGGQPRVICVTDYAPATP